MQNNLSIQADQTKPKNISGFRKAFTFTTLGLIGASIISFFAVFRDSTKAELFNSAPQDIVIGIGYLLIALILFAGMTTLAHRQKVS